MTTSDSTTRLLQILRTTEALIKYYEGHPDSAAVIGELKKHLRRTIEELAMIEAAERGDAEVPETRDGVDMERKR